MAASGVESHPGLPAQRPANAVADDPHALRGQLVSLVKLVVIGGVAFAIGFLGTVAIRSFGLAADVTTMVGGAV